MGHRIIGKLRQIWFRENEERCSNVKKGETEVSRCSLFGDAGSAIVA